MASLHGGEPADVVAAMRQHSQWLAGDIAEVQRSARAVSPLPGPVNNSQVTGMQGGLPNVASNWFIANANSIRLRDDS